MSKHTPGPWLMRESATHVTVTNARGDAVFHDDKRIPGVMANARLIAAAPDLLEALQWYEAKAVQMGRAAIDQDSKLLLELMKEIAVEYGAQARAAIAKATGEQP